MPKEKDGALDCSHCGFLVVIESEIVDVVIKPKIIEMAVQQPSIRSFLRTRVLQCFRCQKYFNFAADLPKVVQKLDGKEELPQKSN